jgi:hypothetical protein
MTEPKKQEERPLTISEQKEQIKMAEQKKKVNVLLSRRSGEESSTGYQTTTTTFAGGHSVQTRSRISLVGRNTEGDVGRHAVGKVRSRLGFAMSGRYGAAKTDFAKNKDYGSATARPANSALGGGTPGKQIGFVSKIDKI